MQPPDRAEHTETDNYRRIASQYLRDKANPQLRFLAIPFYQKALTLEPNNTQTLLELGSAYRRLGNSGEACACCEKALAIDPEFIEAQVRWTVWQLPVLHERVEDIEQCRRNFLVGLQKLETMLTTAGPETLARAASGGLVVAIPGGLAYQGYDIRDLQQRYGALISRVMAAVYPQWTTAPLAAAPASGPLRVGLVSPYFKNNQHWRMLIKGWVSQLDRQRFALYCYAPGLAADAATDFARRHSAAFLSGERTLEEWSQAIRQDKLHVLIYPEMGMDGLVERLAALRLAPAQCVAWGNPITSGLPTIDYFLSSDLAEPDEAAAHYSEKLVRLPKLSSYLEPIEWSASDDSRADLGLRDEAIVYLCDQWLVKYLPQYDAIFPQIATAVPDCQFVFNSRSCLPATIMLFERRLEQAFAAYGLSWKQFVFMRPDLAAPRYHRLCQLSDVFLDSLGYSGATTTMEAALAHDLPVVTFAGEFMRGRQTLAILRRMGLTETIAVSVAQFVDLAIRLGADAQYRAHIAAEITANKHKVYHDSTAIAGLETFLERAAGKALSL